MADNPSPETEPPVPNTPRPSDVISDCQVMLRFALKESCEIPQDLHKAISRLDQYLIEHELPPITNAPLKLLKLPPDSLLDHDEPLVSPTELILSVHVGLSKVVAPATALSLQISEPPPGRHRFFGGMPPIVKIASAMAFFFAVLFILSTARIAVLTATVPATVKESPVGTPSTARAAGQPAPSVTPSPTP